MIRPPRFVFRSFAALLVSCAWVISIHAAEKSSSYRAALESIQADDLGGKVAVLADDAMEGREAGTRGGKAAADHLAKQYAAMGLRGAVGDGAFLQPFAPNFRNVLAILTGSDAELRDEVIVVGAHYDHIGYGASLSLGPSGYIHPGADDNASGTSAVLALAKAFTMLSERPKRSILFAAWDAEEKGLLGSKNFVAHPSVPLKRIVAAFNLDMVGRLRDDRLLVLGTRSGYGWRRLLCQQNDESGLRFDFYWGPMKPNADYFPFFDHDIPVLMFHTGVHDQYHRPTDTAKLINRSGMERITRLLFGVVYDLAERPTAPPRFRAAARHESNDTEAAILSQIVKPADRLGVGWTEDAAKTGGIVVSFVAAGSAAEEAGLRVGDRIVRFAGRDIRSDDDFYAAVAAADSPAETTVEREDEEKPIELTMKLPGSPLRWGIAWRVDEAEPSVVILTHVVPGSPAAHAGLAVGDRIYQVGGRDFDDEIVFSKLAKSLPLPLHVLVEREGRVRTVVLQPPQVEQLKWAA